VVATRSAHVPGRGSGGYKASPCTGSGGYKARPYTWKGEWWLQGQPMYLEGGVVATRPAHVPGRGSGGYKASPCTWKGERWLQGQTLYLEGGVVATRPARVSGRGSVGYKASPCIWKGEWWLQGQPMYLDMGVVSCVLEVRPARRADACAPLSAGDASPPPPCWPWGGENLLHLSPPVKETVSRYV
jgi:hypothetical protein